MGVLKRREWAVSKLHARRPPNDSTASDARVERAKTEPTGSSRRVLVVDDNVDAAQLLAELVEVNGHRAVIAYDGPSALEARRFGPEVALLDIGLPVMDGYELALQLRWTLGGETPRLVARPATGRRTIATARALPASRRTS
jgi:CheY-like chemotaxis protein